MGTAYFISKNNVMSHIDLIIFQIFLSHTQEYIYLLILIRLWILNSLNCFL